VTPSLAGATQDEVRRANLSLVLRLLHRRGPLSRSEIGSTSGLNRSTVGGLVTELVDLGLVIEGAGVVRGVGRPSLVVEPVSSSAVALALDVRVDRTVGALVGLGGEVFTRMEHRHVDALGDPGRIVREVADVGREILSAAPSGAAWIGTGVGVPGIVRAEDGLVRQAPNLGWIDVPFARLLGDALGGGARGVQVRNDADLGALAEHLRGAAQAVDSLIFLAGDVGIGGGVIIDGHPLVGAGGYGGEVGHVRVNPSGRPCRCGAVGCWETEVGVEALVDSAAGCGLDGVTALDVLEAARAGDPAALRAVNEVSTWLGVGLVNLLHVLNPQAVVLGGHLAAIHGAAPEAVTNQLTQALPAAREQVVIVPAALGGDAVLIGGAEVAFEELLGDPAGRAARFSAQPAVTSAG
jgi:predicted NBD/HSP70 family sugar kinase